MVASTGDQTDPWVRKMPCLHTHSGAVLKLPLGESKSHVVVLMEGLDRDNMLSLPFVFLQFKANLTHALCAFAWFDLICLLTLGGVLRAHLLPHLLPPPLTLLLKSFDNIDGASFGHVGMVCTGSFVVVTKALGTHSAEQETATR